MYKHIVFRYQPSRVLSFGAEMAIASSAFIDIVDEKNEENF